MRRFLAATIGLALSAGFLVGPVYAQGGEWHVGQVPFTLNVSDHTGASWTANLAQAGSDWSASTTLDLNVTTANAKISVYNGFYGANYPWAWTTLTRNGGYLKTATIQLNDTYLAGATPEQRQHAICAELGNAIDEIEGCRDRVTGEWFTVPTSQDFTDLVTIYGS